MKKALVGLVAAAVALVGLATPSDAEVVAEVVGVQHYNYWPIQIAPIPVGSVILLSGSGVIGATAKVQPFNCWFEGGGTEGVVAAVPFGHMEGQCLAGTTTIDCEFDYSRVALWMEMNGSCGTQAFVGELEWAGLPGSFDANLAGFIQIV
jgi:hypothetical protein